MTDPCAVGMSVLQSGFNERQVAFVRGFAHIDHGTVVVVPGYQLYTGELPLQGSPGLVQCAAFSVFISRLVIVMGPTPPGTGAIHELFGATSSNFTSPTKRKPLFLLASGMR